MHPVSFAAIELDCDSACSSLSASESFFCVLSKRARRDVVTVVILDARAARDLVVLTNGSKVGSGLPNSEMSSDSEESRGKLETKIW